MRTELVDVRTKETLVVDINERALKRCRNVEETLKLLLSISDKFTVEIAADIYSKYGAQELIMDDNLDDIQVPKRAKRGKK